MFRNKHNKQDPNITACLESLLLDVWLNTIVLRQKKWGCRRLAEGDSPGLKGKNHDHLQCVDFKRCVKFILLLQFIVIDFLGLVNGCQGIVKKFCYLPGSDVRINLLSVVFIQCNRYSGIKQVLPHQVMRELLTRYRINENARIWHCT
jgi:hypothetical protein